MELKASKLLPASVAKGALVKAFGIDESYVDVEVTAGRRLAAHTTDVTSKIAYTVHVPADVKHTDLLAKVKEINSGGAAQDAFVSHLDSAGVKVDKASIKAPTPTVSEVMLVVGKDGKLKEKPVPAGASPAPAPAPSPAAEEGGNVAAIVGGVVGGLVGVAIIGGVLYYFLVVKKKEG